MNELRKFIKLLVERHNFSNGILEKIPEIEIIPAGKEHDGHIGEGGFGDVFEVLWNGKRAVAKIFTEKNEHKVHQKLIELKKSLPRVIMKHLPTIYKMYEIPGTGVFAFRDIYVTVLEYLAPLPNGLKGVSFDDVRPSKTKMQLFVAQINYLIKNPDVLREEIKNIINNELDKIEEPNKQFNSQQRSARTLQKNNQIIDYVINDIIDELPTCLNEDDPYKELRILINNNCYKLNRINEIQEHKLMSKIYEKIKDFIFSDKMVPYSHANDKNLNNFADKRVTALYKALKWLNKNEILSWEDLHEDNVMLRPSDNTLVAVDVGFFGTFDGNED